MGNGYVVLGGEGYVWVGGWVNGLRRGREMGEEEEKKKKKGGFDGGGRRLDEDGKKRGEGFGE